MSNPWGTNPSSSEEDTTVQNQSFQDNFVDKLPDSQEYLNKLEGKLNKLQKKSIAQQLSLRRSDDAKRMLDANAASIELFEDADVEEKSAINRRLFPEKQALTMSEIAKLLESDTLAKATEDLEDSEAKPEISADWSKTGLSLNFSSCGIKVKLWFWWLELLEA